MSNLATENTEDPRYYGVYFNGLTTGPAARENWVNGDSATGVYVTFYENTSPVDP